MDDYAYGGWVCPLDGGLGLQILQVLQTLSGTTSAVLCQTYRVKKGSHQLHVVVKVMQERNV